MAIYMWRDTQPITTAGIYHNPDLGLISLSSDGSTWITIADKNLGATQVYNSGDTEAETNCGKFYQRGNNYGFPFAGAFTTSTTRVDASTYGPGNYYSNSTFRYRSSSPYNWDNSGNSDLRGGTTGTNIARRGPCDEGYHIPSKSDFDSILSIFTSLGINHNMSSIEAYLKLSNKKQITVYGSYGTSTQTSIWLSDAYSDYGRNILIDTYDIISDTYSGRCQGFSIRPFKNDAVQPREGWTVLYQ